MVQAIAPRVLRFGKFVIDLRGRTLHKNGFRIKLHRQPLEILILLLERPGEVITREELQRKLWSTDTFVDFENGLNAAVKKLRHSLDDSAGEPRYIETVPRLGYRFIASVENVETALPQSAPKPRVVVTELALPERPFPIKPPAPRRATKLFVFLAPALTLSALALLYAFRPFATPPHVVRIRQLTHLATVESQQNIVTDGPRVYFRERTGDRRALEYVSTEGGEPYVLPSSSTFDIHGMSGDGSTLLVGSVTEPGENPLWALPANGGSPRRLGNVKGLDSSWSSDGRRLAFMMGGAIYTANADGSASTKLAEVPGTPFCPRWSPDSSRLRFVCVRSDSGPMELWEIAADGKSGAHPILPVSSKTDHPWGGAWSPDSRFFFFSSIAEGVHCIWALRDKTDWWHKPDVGPIQLTAGPISYSHPGISRDGKTLFVVGEERRGELLRYDSKKHRFSPFLPNLSADHVAFSRDGQWMAYVRYPDATLWRSKVDGSEPLQLTQSPLRAYLPHWSPDGKWIAFEAVAENGQSPKAFRVAADNKEPAEPFEIEDLVVRSLDWSPDGSAIVVAAASTHQPETSGIAIMDLKTKRIEWIPGSQKLKAPQWSPDGQHLAAVPKVFGRDIAWLVSKGLELYDFQTRQWSDIGLDNLDYAAWSRDGKLIYFNTFTSLADRSIFELRVADRKLQKLATVADMIPTGVYGTWSGMAPDGSPLVLRDAGSRDIYALDLDLP